MQARGRRRRLRVPKESSGLRVGSLLLLTSLKEEVGEEGEERKEDEEVLDR